MKRQYLLLGFFIVVASIGSGFFSNALVYALTIASIGDSYASGEGNPDKPQTFKFFGDVEKGPVWLEDKQCHRSRFAGPYLAAHELARIVNQPLTFIGVACTGAQIPKGLLGPFDPETDDRANPVVSQIEQLKARVGSGRIDLLFISIGGNDVGFANLIKNCILLDSIEAVAPLPALCRHSSDVQDTLKINQESLPGKYKWLAEQLRTIDIGAVLITEYPDPTKGANGKFCGEFMNSRIMGMHPETVRWAYHRVLKPLNAAIHAAATEYGWTVVPTMDLYAKHGYCAGKARWFVTEEEARFTQGPYEFGFSERDRLSIGTISSGSLHPNMAGHLAYAQQIVSTALPIIGTVISGVPVKEKSNDEIYVIHGGAKFYIPDQATLERLFGRNPAILTVPDGALAQMPLVPRDGTLLKEFDDRIHVIYGGAKFYISEQATLERLFGRNPVILTVPNGALAQMPLVPRDGTLLKELDDRIHVVYGGAKFYIPDPPTLKKLFGESPSIMTVPNGALRHVPLAPRDGTLLKELDDRIYVVYGGAKFYIPDNQTLHGLFGCNPTIVTVPDGALRQVPLVPRDGMLLKELDDRIHVVYGGAKFYIPDTPTLKKLFGESPSIMTVPDGALAHVPLVPRDGTLLKEFDDRIHVIYGGAKFYISEQATLERLFGRHPAILTVPDGALAQMPLVPRDGTLLKEFDDRIHVIYGGAKFYILDQVTLERLFGHTPVIATVPDEALAHVPLVPRDGTLLKEFDDRIHVIYGGAKFYISDQATLERLFGKNSAIATVPDGTLMQMPVVPRDGSLLKELTDQKIYLIKNGTKYWVSSPEEFTRLGLAETDVKTVPDGLMSQLPDREVR